MNLEWSRDAIADLDRFAIHLRAERPGLAGTIADAITEQAKTLERHPEMGRPLGRGGVYRQLALRVEGSIYLFQYRYDGARLMMLRVFHHKEARGA
jgi:plasmid stabilization system protein ParE